MLGGLVFVVSLCRARLAPWWVVATFVAGQAGVMTGGDGTPIGLAGSALLALTFGALALSVPGARSAHRRRHPVGRRGGRRLTLLVARLPAGSTIPQSYAAVAACTRSRQPQALARTRLTSVVTVGLSRNISRAMSRPVRRRASAMSSSCSRGVSRARSGGGVLGVMLLTSSPGDVASCLRSVGRRAASLFARGTLTGILRSANSPRRSLREPRRTACEPNRLLVHRTWQTPTSRKGQP